MSPYRLDPTRVQRDDDDDAPMVIVWLAIAFAILLGVVIAVAILATSRSGSAFSPTPAQTEAPPAVGDGASFASWRSVERPSKSWSAAGHPGEGPSAPSGAETAGGASPDGDTSPTIGMRPASVGAVAAASPPAATSGVVYRGTATWYCSDGRDGSRPSPCTRGYGPSDLVAAIDRKDSEFRKGDLVLVRHGDRSVVVRIVDTCKCVDARVIDLTIGAFQELAPWGAGVLSVTLERADGIRLPETDR